jgi:hypothetical protein
MDPEGHEYNCTEHTIMWRKPGLLMMSKQLLTSWLCRFRKT